MKFKKIDKVLVIATHPDDETLGCGGTLLKHKSNQDKIYWLVVTDEKKEYGYSQKLITLSKNKIRLVTKKYNFNGVYNLHLPPKRLDEFPFKDLILKFSAIFHKLSPTIIYIPFKNDVHSDHRITFAAAYACTKSFRFRSLKKVYMMETLSETEFAPATKESVFAPNVFVDISRFMNKKIEITKIYKSEIRNHPFPRSIKNIKALASLRGSRVGCRYAESFMLLKEIL